MPFSKIDCVFNGCVPKVIGGFYTKKNFLRVLLG